MVSFTPRSSINAQNLNAAIKNSRHWQRNVILFLQEQEAYVRAKYLFEDWVARHPSFGSDCTQRRKVYLLSVLMGLTLPVWNNSDKHHSRGILYQNIYFRHAEEVWPNDQNVKKAMDTLRAWNVHPAQAAFQL